MKHPYLSIKIRVADDFKPDDLPGGLVWHSALMGTLPGKTYFQGMGHLRKHDGEKFCDCCLGVASDLFGRLEYNNRLGMWCDGGYYHKPVLDAKHPWVNIIGNNGDIPKGVDVYVYRHEEEEKTLLRSECGYIELTQLNDDGVPFALIAVVIDVCWNLLPAPPEGLVDGAVYPKPIKQ